MEKKWIFLGNAKKTKNGKKNDIFEEISIFFHFWLFPDIHFFSIFFSGGKKYPFSLLMATVPPKYQFFAISGHHAAHHISLSPVSCHWSSKGSNFRTNIFKNIILATIFRSSLKGHQSGSENQLAKCPEKNGNWKWKKNGF